MKKQKIKQALTIVFVTGCIVGGITGGIIGYLFGTGILQLPEPTEPCYAVQCDCIERDIYGHEIPKSKNWHCGLHGHDCEYGR
jgi:hypothetical protein